MASLRQVAVFGVTATTHFVSGLRRHMDAAAVQSLDWELWGEAEAKRVNKELGFEETNYAEYDRAALVEQGESTALKPSPCYAGSPCVNGKRGWWHTCSEKIEAGDPSSWQKIIDQVNCVPVAIQAGNASGPFFTIENYGRTMSEVFATFSGGKRPAAAAMGRAVAAGNITFETKANEVFDWWSKDPKDLRCNVTLADLLHFTSGFTAEGLWSFDHDTKKHTCLNSKTAGNFNLETCAKQIYENSKYVPLNTQYQYNSLHLQLAMAMVVKRSGMSATQYLKENLYEPCNMKQTYFGGYENPMIAGGMMTTGNDYAGFLRAYLGTEYLPKNVIDVMETEYRNAHHIPDVGTAVTMPDWGMAQFHLQGFPECWAMGGSQQNCINRAAGTYWMLLPRVKEYYGRALGGGILISAQVLMYARFWIQQPMRDALAPLGNPAVESTTFTTTEMTVSEEEKEEKAFELEEDAAKQQEEANGVSD